MTELVIMRESEPMTTSLAISEGIEYEHKAVIQLIRKYSEDLSEFGPSAFEMRMVDRPQGGGKPVEYALLNEPQATLLMTYMRNTPIVRQFKKNLVRAFYEMHTAIREPGNKRQTPEIKLTIDIGRLAKQADQHLDGKASLRLLNHLTGIQVNDLIHEIEVKGLETATTQFKDAELVVAYLFAVLHSGSAAEIEYSTDNQGRQTMLCTTAVMLAAMEQAGKEKRLPKLGFSANKMGSFFGRQHRELEELGWQRTLEKIATGQRLFRYTCLEVNN
jgi:phage regulator Rha-like protein